MEKITKNNIFNRKEITCWFLIIHQIQFKWINWMFQQPRDWSLVKLEDVANLPSPYCLDVPLTDSSFMPLVAEKPWPKQKRKYSVSMARIQPETLIRVRWRANKSDLYWADESFLWNWWLGSELNVRPPEQILRTCPTELRTFGHDWRFDQFG